MLGDWRSAWHTVGMPLDVLATEGKGNASSFFGSPMVPSTGGCPLAIHAMLKRDFLGQTLTSPPQSCSGTVPGMSLNLSFFSEQGGSTRLPQGLLGESSHKSVREAGMFSSSKHYPSFYLDHFYLGAQWSCNQARG